MVALGERPVRSPDVEALIREARRRRRRRRIAISAVIAVVGGVVAILAVHHGGGGARSEHGRPAASPTPVTPAPAHVRIADAPLGHAPPEVITRTGAFDDRAGWAAEAQHRIWITSDRGRTWHTITPSSGPQLLDNWFSSIAAAGGDDLWIGAGNVVGLVPNAESVDGSSRGEEILHSTDGGTTWATSTLPGCAQTCGGDISLSFIDRDHGYAAIGQFLYASTDGGAEWTRISVLPFPSDSTQITFPDPEHGWALAARTGEPSSVYRSTDGGATWKPADGLPADGTLERPQFVDRGHGTTLETAPALTVFQTRDGGDTWTAHPVPTRALTSRTGVWFSAPAPGTWFLAAGQTLLATTDAGTHWTTTDERAAWPARNAKSSVWGLAFFSPRDGWALVDVPPCSRLQCRGLDIITTHDRGKTWYYANL